MKKTIVFTSGIIGAFLLLSYRYGNYALCQNDDSCAHVLHYLYVLFSPVTWLFIFSLLTYRLPERYFRAWSRFALVWIPLSMILVVLAPEYISGGLFIQIGPVFTKSYVSNTSSQLFALISTLILLVVWVRSRGKRRSNS